MSNSIENPCPNCGATRSSIESACDACDWSPPIERSQTRERERPPFQFGLSKWGFLILLFATHAGLVSWSINNTSPGLLLMEGGGAKTIRHMIADAMVLFLNLPLTTIGVFVFNIKDAPAVYVLSGLNSMLWAVAALWVSRFVIRLLERQP